MPAGWGPARKKEQEEKTSFEVAEVETGLYGQQDVEGEKEEKGMAAEDEEEEEGKEEERPVERTSGASRLTDGEEEEAEREREEQEEGDATDEEEDEEEEEFEKRTARFSGDESEEVEFLRSLSGPSA